MAGRILHLLSQRPSLTGSGVTLDALVRHAADAGWDQWVVAGTPATDPTPEVGGLPDDRIRPLRFGTTELPFQVPGMSDVMPYPSTRFSSMTEEQIASYRSAWTEHLGQVIDQTRPDVIHSHHVWLLSGLLKDVAANVPVVVQCHATGLRQMELCPHLAHGVVSGNARNDRFVVLHNGHADALAGALHVSADRITLVGAGYRDQLFHMDDTTDRSDLVYVGKYSPAKGLPWLLDAVEQLGPSTVLHVAGSGAGVEADALRSRMEGMGQVRLHGQLTQSELAGLMRRCAVCVLPSFYEGVPLVLVEALACGCRLVATRLPGVVDQLAPHLGPYMELLSPPRLEEADEPVPQDLPGFVTRLVAALQTALSQPPLTPDSRLQKSLAPFTWQAVFERVEKVWLSLGAR